MRRSFAGGRVLHKEMSAASVASKGSPPGGPAQGSPPQGGHLRSLIDDWDDGTPGVHACPCISSQLYAAFGVRMLGLGVRMGQGCVRGWGLQGVTEGPGHHELVGQGSYKLDSYAMCSIASCCNSVTTCAGEARRNPDGTPLSILNVGVLPAQCRGEHTVQFVHIQSPKFMV